MTYPQAMAVSAQVSTLSVDPPSGALTIDASSNPTIFEVSGTVKCSGVSITNSNTRVKLEPGASYLLMGHISPHKEAVVSSGITDILEIYFYNVTGSTQIDNAAPQSGKIGGTQIYHATTYGTYPFQHKEMGPFIITALVKSSNIPSGGIEIEVRADVTSTNTSAYDFSGNDGSGWTKIRTYMTITQV